MGIQYNGRGDVIEKKFDSNFILKDIECYPNYFEVGIKDYKSKDTITFEISEDIDERKSLFKYLTSYKGYTITFNGLHYDNIVLAYFVKEYSKLAKLSRLEFCKAMKEFSNLVINSTIGDENKQKEIFEKIKSYKWHKHGWTDIDLFAYWSKMLRISKKISLKSLGIQLGYKEVQELPYKHDKILSAEERESIKYYNVVNDLGVLDLLCNDMQGEIKLRQYISNTYDLPCWSMDAPKIASELLLDDYCKQLYNEEKDGEYADFKKQIRGRRFELDELVIEDVLNGFDPKFELPVFQDFFKRVLKSSRSFGEEFPLNYGNTSIMMSYGIGGAHSIQKNECFKSTEDEIIVTSDYASLYPNIIINWLCIRYKEVLEKYIAVKADRIVAKKTKDKQKDKLLKLILNSLSGLLDNKHSWMYYPEGALRMRIIGQLIITKTMEIVMKNGWRVISVNTDGIECIIPKKDFDRYQEALKEAEQLFNIDLEHGVYDFINYANVNNYIGKMGDSVKRKGFFKLDYNEKGDREIPLGDSVNELVISKALNLYFTKDIPIDESIRNPHKYGFHIYDYCKSNKISKDYVVYWNGKKQQQLNRYYFSKNAPYLLKKKKDKDNFDHVNVGEGVQIFNKFEEKSWEDYGINYAHYTKKAREILSSLTEKQRQLSLF